jgi:Arc/MetJ family transcription regulator
MPQLAEAVRTLPLGDERDAVLEQLRRTLKELDAQLFG